THPPTAEGSTIAAATSAASPTAHERAREHRAPARRLPTTVAAQGQRAADAAAARSAPGVPSQPGTTAVAGGIVTVPTGAPTSGDPSKFDVSGLSTEEWTGDWTGVSVAKITNAHVDVATGQVTATILDTFTGTYAGDHSTGTLIIDETFDGNVFTGAGVVTGRIVGSSGDPTFQCSTGT